MNCPVNWRVRDRPPAIFLDYNIYDFNRRLLSLNFVDSDAYMRNRKSCVALNMNRRIEHNPRRILVLYCQSPIPVCPSFHIPEIFPIHHPDSPILYKARSRLLSPDDSFQPKRLPGLHASEKELTNLLEVFAGESVVLLTAGEIRQDHLRVCGHILL